MPLPLYFVQFRSLRGGLYFGELDPDDNSAGAVRCLIRHDPSVVKVLEVTEPCEDFPYGRCVDVTDDIRREALAGVVPEPREPFDHQTWRHDHIRDLRKHELAE